MTTPTPIFLASLVLIGLSVALGVFLGLRKQRLRARLQAAFDDMQRRLAHTLAMRLVSESMAQGYVERDGVSVVVDLTRGAQGLPPFLRVRVPFVARRADAAFAAMHGAVSSGPAASSFRRRTMADRLGQAIGLVRALRTGDATFDERVIVDSDAPADTVALLLRPAETRAAIGRLLDAGVLRVDLFHGAVEIVALRRQPTVEHAATALDVARELAGIVRALPAFSTDPVLRPNALRSAWMPITGTGLAALFGGGAVYLHDQFPRIQVDDSTTVLQAGVLIWLVSIVAAFFLARGKTHALRNFGFTVLVMFPTSFAVPYCVEVGRLLLLDGVP